MPDLSNIRGLPAANRRGRWSASAGLSTATGLGIAASLSIGTAAALTMGPEIREVSHATAQVLSSAGETVESLGEPGSVGSAQAARRALQQLANRGQETTAAQANQPPETRVVVVTGKGGLADLPEEVRAQIEGLMGDLESPLEDALGYASKAIDKLGTPAAVTEVDRATQAIGRAQAAQKRIGRNGKLRVVGGGSDAATEDAINEAVQKLDSL